MRTPRIITGLAIVLLAPTAAAQGDFLRSVDTLGDPRGYCFDVPGFGANMRLNSALGTHSCKYSIPGFFVDELFEHTDQNHLRLPEYDYCIAAEALSAGAHPTTVECSSPEVLAWDLREDGRISPADAPSLCITLSAERTYVNTGENTFPPYSSRDLTLEPCQTSLDHLQRIRWSDPMERVTYNANTLQSGMSRELRAANAEIGRAVDPAGTQRAYAGAQRVFSPADVTRSEEISYGRNDRHLLQVYVGNNRNHPRRAARVLVLVHGGGFTRGGLNSLTTVATHFAGLGFVVVNVTYPLAPEYTFPAGAQAVSEAVGWTKENISEYGGNPEQIYVMGQSAGGNHVANFALRPGILRGDVPEVAGVILGSPALSLNPDSLGPAGAEQAYFGAPDTWSEKSLLDNMEGPSAPILILLAEHDPHHMWEAAAQLFSQLVNDYGATPRMRQLLSHGHISYLSSIGTNDRMTEEEILDFISPTGGF